MRRAVCASRRQIPAPSSPSDTSPMMPRTRGRGRGCGTVGKADRTLAKSSHLQSRSIVPERRVRPQIDGFSNEESTHASILAPPGGSAGSRGSSPLAHSAAVLYTRTPMRIGACEGTDRGALVQTRQSSRYSDKLALAASPAPPRRATSRHVSPPRPNCCRFFSQCFPSSPPRQEGTSPRQRDGVVGVVGVRGLVRDAGVDDGYRTLHAAPHRAAPRRRCTL